MKSLVIAALASFFVLLLGAAPATTYNFSVLPNSTNDAQIATAIEGIGATDVWPLNDSTTTTTLFADTANGSNNIGITNNGGISSSYPIVDSSTYSALFSGYTAQARSNATVLNSWQPWTVGITFVPTSLPASSTYMNLWSTGNPVNVHTGVQALVRPNGQVSVYVGTGASGGTYTGPTAGASVSATTLNAAMLGHTLIASWTPATGASSANTTNAGTLSLWLDGVAAAPQSVAAFQSTTTPLGLAVNDIETNNAAPLQGYAQYLFYGPFAATQAEVSTVQNAESIPASSNSGGTTASVTLPAAQLANSINFDTGFEGVGQAVEAYYTGSTATNPTIRAMNFMRSAHIRDGYHCGPGSACTTASANYSYLCNTNPTSIAQSQGFNISTGGSTLTGSTTQGVATYLTSAVSAGANTATVNDVTGSNDGVRQLVAGDKILFDPWGTYGTVNVTEGSGSPAVMTIASINGNTVTFTTAFAHNHVKGALLIPYSNSTDIGLAPVPLTVAYVTGYFDDDNTNTGCYPDYAEGANEPDNGGATSPGDGADPSDVNPGSNQMPFWATLSVKQMETLLAARNSNAKYSRIKVISVGLAGSNNYRSLAQAAVDLHTQNAAAVPLPLPLDALAQHTSTAYHAPELSQGVSAQAPLPFAGPIAQPTYQPAPLPTSLPLWWTEAGNATNSVYYGNGNALTDDLGAHWYPRESLAYLGAGIKRTYWDFAGVHTGNDCLSGSSQFCDVNWLDAKGNMLPGAYATGNMTNLLADAGNQSCNPLTFTPTQLQFTAVGTVSTSTDQVVAYAFEKCDGSFWIALVRATEEEHHYSSQASWQGGTGGNDLSNRAAPENVTLTFSGNPSTVWTVAKVFQNDESCNLTRNQPPIVPGASFYNWPSGVTGSTADCYQYWPAGLLNGSIQPSYPTIAAASGSKTFTVEADGMPLVVELYAGPSNTATPPPVPTQTPIAPYNVATPTIVSSYPTVTTTIAPTPAPPYGPPSPGATDSPIP